MTVKAYPETALAGLRVLDLADEKAMYCGKLLADMGADVIKVERPGGDPTRNIGPFVDDRPHPERSLYFWHFNTNKRGITLSLETTDGREIFRRLAANADVVLETFDPGYLEGLGLGYRDLSALNPGLVLASVTGFGQTGPYAHYKSSDLVALAMGGMLHVCGQPDKSPIMACGGQAFHTASHYAAIGTLVALQNRRVTGKGQHVDISLQECVDSVIEHVNDWYHYSGTVAERQGGLHWGRGLCLTECKDGYFLCALPNEALVRRMIEDGFGSELLDPKWQDPPYRLANVMRMHDEIFRPWARLYTKEELFQIGQQCHIAFAPCNRLGEVMEDPHLKERGFFVPVDHPELGRTSTYPGAPYKLGESPWRLAHRAPLIGEHNEEILGQELAICKEQLSSLASGGITQTGRHSPPAVAKSPAPVPPRRAKGERKPLAGIKVVDFTWVLAGPFCTRLLAFMGAEVIKIEPREIGDRTRRLNLGMFRDGKFGVNRSGFYNNNNPGKLGITLDVKHPKGKALVEKMVARADVVVENFSARVMPSWGLGYASLKKIKPDVIMVSMPGMGLSGPYKDYVSYGPTIQAMCGFNDLMGYHDRGPVGFSYSYSDHVGGIYGALGTLMALEYRARTGQGQHVEVSQFEAMCALLETATLDYTVNGRVQKMKENRLPHFAAAPHGVYPCKGEDRWLAIAVFGDEEWQGFCEAIGRPRWTADEEFRTLLGRLANQDELDRLVGEWTSRQVAEEAMHLLQRHGVPAGVAQDAPDLYHDPQIAERGYFVHLPHAELGQVVVEGVPIKLSDTPGSFDHAAPLLGEFNDHVLRDILGLSEDEVNDLLIDGVI